MYDVFISYENETKMIADNIVNHFEKNEVKCWYAPRDVIGPYAQSIVTAIKKAKVFVLILNERSSSSHHVLNEVESAYKQMDENGLIILPFKLTKEKLSDAMNYYIKRFHWVDASNDNLPTAIDELLSRAKDFLGIKKVKAVVETRLRESNKYYTYEDDSEVERLTSQRYLLEKVTKDSYQRVFDQYEEPIILDVGSNDGFLTNEIHHQAKAKLTIGLECDQSAVKAANDKFGADTMFFYHCDIEADDFNDYLKELLKKHKVEGFDVVNISMVLLHLKNPFKVLKVLRRYMKKGASIIIKDIDDGLNMVYPDPGGLFKYATDMINRNPRWGYRQSGRQIYSFLTQLGASSIALTNIGLNTVGMDFIEKEAFFHTHFGGMLPDLKYLVSLEPHNRTYQDDLTWIKANLERLEEAFFHNDFFFNLGYVVYIAKV